MAQPEIPAHALSIWIEGNTITIATRAERICIPAGESARLVAVLRGMNEDSARREAIFRHRRDMAEAEWAAARARKMQEIRDRETARQADERTRMLRKDEQHQKRRAALALARELDL